MTKRKVAKNREREEHFRLVRCEHHHGEESGVLIGVIGEGVGVGVGGHGMGL